MNETKTLEARLDDAVKGLRRAIEFNAEAERLAARHMDIPGVSPQLQAIRAATAAAVAADTSAQRAYSFIESLSLRGENSVELALACSSAAEAVGHAAEAAAQALAVLSGLVNQRTRFERRGRGS